MCFFSCIYFSFQGFHSELSNDEKNAKIWHQTTSMSDMAKKYGFLAANNLPCPQSRID